MKDWIWNPKTKNSNIITCIPQEGFCPINCEDCFFQSGRSYLEPFEKNIPHIPSDKMAEGRIVRVNDGNDSNNNFELVVEKTKNFKDKFYNTSLPINLDKFPGPVVLTINPAKMTDKKFHKVNPIPKNLMFVRIRSNPWNIENVIKPAVEYYTSKEVPVVLTHMAYYTEKINEEFQDFYTFKKRTLNSYYVLNKKGKEYIINYFSENPFVYECGYKETHSCTRCGNCLREFHNTKERIRIID